VKLTPAHDDCSWTRPTGQYNPGVNFINILQVAFTNTYPKSAKIQSSRQSFLCFWDLHA